MSANGYRVKILHINKNTVKYPYEKDLRILSVRTFEWRSTHKIENVTGIAASTAHLKTIYTVSQKRRCEAESGLADSLAFNLYDKKFMDLLN